MDDKYTIISFSSRRNGNCEQISDYLCSKLLGNYTAYSFAKLTIQPCGNCNYDCFTDAAACPYIEDMEYTLLQEVCCSDYPYLSFQITVIIPAQISLYLTSEVNVISKDIPNGWSYIYLHQSF